MPDISMCLNHQCVKRLSCKRYASMPSAWQSYAMFEGGEKCGFYLPYIIKSNYSSNTEIKED